MKLISLSMVGYRQFLDKSEVHFPQGMTGICGPNGVGKSKLIEAIGFALYGPRAQILPAGDKREFIPSLAADHPQTEVVLTIEVKAERYVITRTLTRAEIRIAGAAEALVTTPSAVTAFVTRLLRLTAEAFVGTFVARQNEVAKLHTLEKKPRVDLVHRLIGISQLQVAIELAEKGLDEDRQGLRRAEAVLLTNSAEIEAEIVDFETAVKLVVADEQKIGLELAACVEELQQKRAALEEMTRNQEQRASKGRELDLQRTSHRQTLSQQAKVRSDWERADAALVRQTVISAELAVLTDAEAQFQYWELMSARESLLQQQRSWRVHLSNELEPAQEILLYTQNQQQELDKETEPIVEEIAASKTKKTVAAHRKSQAQKMLTSFESKRKRMAEIGPGGICENCGMTLKGESYQVALESCDHSVLQYELEKNEAAQEEFEWIEYLRNLDQKHFDLQTKKRGIKMQLANLAAVPGQVEAIERQLVECDEHLTALGIDDSVEPFLQPAYDSAKENLNRRNILVSDLLSVSVLAEQEERYRTDLRETHSWLEQLVSKIQTLEDDIQRLIASESLDRVTEEAFQSVEEKHRQLVERGRDALQFRTRAETQLEERHQNFEKIKAQEANLNLLREKLLTSERTLELLRQMLTEINDEARPRLAELMDTWLRSLIGEKFQAVTLTEDYRVQADCGAGFRLLDHFSGGEQTLLAVMLRVAISLFCQERAGFDTSFLILDEVFGNQDVVHRNQLVSFLTEIQEHYHQILIVNHVEDVTQMLDTIIEIVPITLNTSCIKSNAAAV